MRGKMKILVACEYSGIVRDAFSALGHDAMSCDLLPTDSPGKHYTGDMFDLALNSFDLVIAHPPCTAICVSGNRYYANTRARLDGVAFVERIWDSVSGRLAIENPVGVLSTMSTLGKPSQYIQPWQFGHGETKKTGLWLRGLPKLVPTNIVDGREQRIWKMSPSEDRWKERSKTFPGIAAAMAEQWGFLE